MNILLVDDERDYLSLLGDCLRGRGHHCQSAGSLAEADLCLKVTAVETMLLDVVLPDGLGNEEVARYRRDHPGMDIVLVSAQNNVRTAMEAVRAGVEDYLTKPLELAQLYEVLERVESRRRSQAAALRSGGSHLSPLEQVERRAIQNALNQFGNHRTKAAAYLNITRKTLLTKIRLYGLEEA